MYTGMQVCRYASSGPLHSQLTRDRVADGYMSEHEHEHAEHFRLKENQRRKEGITDCLSLIHNNKDRKKRRKGTN